MDGQSWILHEAEDAVASGLLTCPAPSQGSARGPNNVSSWSCDLSKIRYLNTAGSHCHLSPSDFPLCHFLSCRWHWSGCGIDSIWIEWDTTKVLQLLPWDTLSPMCANSSSIRDKGPETGWQYKHVPLCLQVNHKKKKKVKVHEARDFPGFLVVKNVPSNGTGHGLDPQQGNWDPTCHGAIKLPGWN